MNRKFLKLGVSAIAISLAAGSTAYAQGNAEATEQVVVMGSRVITNGNDSPTPLTVISTADITATAPATVFDIDQDIAGHPGGQGQLLLGQALATAFAPVTASGGSGNAGTGTVTAPTVDSSYASNQLLGPAMLTYNGGMFSGCTPEQVESLHRFGTAIGTAFQISDDVTP